MENYRDVDDSEGSASYFQKVTALKDKACVNGQKSDGSFTEK